MLPVLQEQGMFILTGMLPFFGGVGGSKFDEFGWPCAVVVVVGDDREIVEKFNTMDTPKVY